MNRFLFCISGFKLKKLFIFLAVLSFAVFLPQNSYAHQQPTTLVLMDVNPDKVALELQIPLSELELAFGNDVDQNTETLVERLTPQLSEYLIKHIRPATENQPWTVEIKDMQVGKAEQTQSGAYQEITVHLNLTPPTGIGTRKFTLNYDVIMHQVVSHRALVSIRNDWESGNVREKLVEAGVIMVDTQTTQIFPLEINLEKGSLWAGFKGMVGLGMQHIKEGTDHLLFLLVLLLPATLLSKSVVWGDFAGSGKSVKRLLKIVTAFTVGHSLTLLVGALNLVRLPQQPIEVLIAVSILVSAVHAIRPIFAGKEMYVAAGFGLIHGLAFATVLADLNLGAGPMALSIFGFNLGIELMQVFVIALTIPWLILLSQTPFYKSVRIGGATLASVAACAWIAERLSGSENIVTSSIQNISEYAPIGILILAITAALAFGLEFIKNKNVLVKTR